MVCRRRRQVVKSLLLVIVLAFTGFASSLAVSVSSSRWKHPALGTNGSFLVDASDSPFFWQADTAWELFHRLNHSEVIHYLDDRHAKGFNVVMSVAIPELKCVPSNLVSLISTYTNASVLFGIQCHNPQSQWRFASHRPIPHAAESSVLRLRRLVYRPRRGKRPTHCPCPNLGPICQRRCVRFSFDDSFSAGLATSILFGCLNAILAHRMARGPDTVH